MWTNRQFWLDSTWRAFRTFCQTLASLLAGQAVNLLAAPWSSMLSISAGAALISLLQSIDRERVAITTATTAAPPEPAPAATPTADAVVTPIGTPIDDDTSAVGFCANPR